MTTPTSAQFAAYEGMFKHFNKCLFAGHLRPVVLNFSRHAKSFGFFAPERWEHTDAGAGADQATRHEISLNPATLLGRSPREVASTLVHEMVHLWQEDFGTPSRSGYHNAEWAAQMEGVGLLPTSDGTPQGKRVGQRVTHLIIEGGPFAKAFAELPPELLLPLTCRPEPEARKKKAKNKTKYSCAGGCGANVWGKPDMHIICGDCDERFVDETADVDPDDAE
jgi:predicted SprT family Zn-dependent metalloprotease